MPVLLSEGVHLFGFTEFNPTLAPALGPLRVRVEVAARLQACASKGSSPTLRAMLDEAISDRRIMDALATVRVPRHLFKFMYNLLVAHCNAHTDDQPCWKISSEMFESVLAVYTRDQDAVDRGLRAG